MIPELMRAGLTEKEAKVYFASLELGRATADQISRHARVNRSTTYVQIESLMSFGLMTTFDLGKKTYFAPETPEHLKAILERDKQDFKDRERAVLHMLPDLMNIFAHTGERPVARFFEGKEGIVAIREEMLKSNEKKWLVLFSHDAIQGFFTDEELDRYSERRAKLGILSRAVYTKKDGRYTGGQPPLTERRYLPPERFPIESHIAMFDDTVAFIDYPKKVGALITNTSISKSLKAVFTILWEAAER